MEIKQCTGCKIEKEFKEFNNNKNSKDGKTHKCRLCEKEYKNQPEVKLKNREYDKNNYEKNKNIRKNNFKKFKQNNPTYFAKWFQKNKEIIKEKNKIKYKEDINYRLIQIIRINILQSIQKTKKTKSSIKLLGCDIKFYKEYLESKFLPEMSWENHGEIWEIDHIIPCSSFDLTIEQNQLICFNYKNTQPLFKTTQIAESFGYTDQIGNRNKLNKI